MKLLDRLSYDMSDNTKFKECGDEFFELVFMIEKAT